MRRSWWRWILNPLFALCISMSGREWISPCGGFPRDGAFPQIPKGKPSLGHSVSIFFWFAVDPGEKSSNSFIQFLFVLQTTTMYQAHCWAMNKRSKESPLLGFFPMGREWVWWWEDAACPFPKKGNWLELPFLSRGSALSLPPDGKKWQHWAVFGEHRWPHIGLSSSSNSICTH
jgi:hypothetical protein